MCGQSVSRPDLFGEAEGKKESVSCLGLEALLTLHILACVYAINIFCALMFDQRITPVVSNNKSKVKALNGGAGAR